MKQRKEGLVAVSPFFFFFFLFCFQGCSFGTKCATCRTLRMQSTTQVSLPVVLLSFLFFSFFLCNKFALSSSSFFFFPFDFVSLLSLTPRNASTQEKGEMGKARKGK
eukprot:TRINITY_DN1921_c1_g1_i1.p2 TRINITY_DN1921_c1_g1~~TRINITY_DN1921_c1_g1_i1.p2  ORF type:complete len:107 (-),score=0.47 TRINITY_DN1921_c1_g1_i1:595-915(-)